MAYKKGRQASDLFPMSVHDCPKQALFLFEILISSRRRRKRIALVQRDPASDHLALVVNDLIITALGRLLTGFKPLHKQSTFHMSSYKE